MAQDQALDELFEHAKRGATDEWLANHAGVSVQVVRRWRRKRGLATDKPVQEAIGALQGLAEAYDGAQHCCANALTFDSPEYVLRKALDYTQYARACFALLQARFAPRGIARATGTRLEDVETALAAWRRHLSTHGKRCLGCSTLLDHRFDEFCSTNCHDRIAKR